MASPERKIFTVSRLNQEVQQLLASGFGLLWLEGEVSNFSRPSSGHFYFTLKDSQSQIRCAMFKGRNRYVEFAPKGGDQVLVRGKLGLYSARGDFQLIVEHMEEAGAGRLHAQFEATKRELQAKGWFDESLKTPVPPMPQTIGIVSSPTGAAIRDVLQVLARRYRQATIIIYPTQTQGAAAAPAICRAIQQANRRKETDVLLLVRGGGSLEDLWAYNEISVAQAIANSQLPVVAGIGHEVDVTIADLVSDVRAPTPSAAAELVSPDMQSLQQRIDLAATRLRRLQSGQLRQLRATLEQRMARLHRQHPERVLRERNQRLDELETRLQRSVLSQIAIVRTRLKTGRQLLATRSPQQLIEKQANQQLVLASRLSKAMTARQIKARSRFEVLARTLNSVSPLAILDRGYALIRKGDQIVSSAGSVAAGERISARLSDGEIVATVKSVRQDHTET